MTQIFKTTTKFGPKLGYFRKLWPFGFELGRKKINEIRNWKANSSFKKRRAVAVVQVF